HQLHRFDLFVFEQVCREFKTRYDNGLPLVPVSVNFSMQDFDYANILSEMNALYKKYHLDVLVDKSYFIIEITEQDLAIGTEKLKEQFNLIRENGYRLWLDDFGSGYSALNVFSQFDFDLVKYDMELLKNLDFNNGINRIILKELVFLSKKFGIHTLIEGVETEEQFSFVKEIGCELAQGFYFHKPESLDGILNRIHNGESPKMCETPKERAEFNRKWFE
ncbi:MAG: EAL domain-containing protein, partial [Clostridia bacterium]|nr:EAL domain-containing protein [Clostridia bacterium]